MKNTVFYLSTCSTCKRIMKEFDLSKFILREIKSEALTVDELAFMKEQAGSYEALFSRRSMKYREWDLKSKTLVENDYKEYMLKEYTFLKRPVFIINSKVFVGNTKAVVAKALDAMNG